MAFTYAINDYGIKNVSSLIDMFQSNFGSIYNINDPKEIIISDNGGSYTLKKKYNIPITIIKNGYNYGTMKGGNQIIKLANKSNILFMTDDQYFMNNMSLEKIYFMCQLLF